MADLPSVLAKINDIETDVNAPVSQQLLVKLGQTNNALIDLYNETKIAIITSNSTFEFPAGTTFATFLCAGGGGGGGAAGNPNGNGIGGCGAVPYPVRIPVTAGFPYSITIGAGGAGGSGGNTAGGGGGATSVATPFNTLFWFGALGGGQGGVDARTEADEERVIWSPTGVTTAQNFQRRVGPNLPTSFSNPNHGRAPLLDGWTGYFTEGGAGGGNNQASCYGQPSIYADGGLGYTTTGQGSGGGGGAGWGNGGNGGRDASGFQAGQSAAANSSAGGGGGSELFGGGNGGSGICIILY